jgi:anti-sigma regulatory factor (Ser/Thr protein kinase)
MRAIAMARLNLHDVTTWITALALQHPHDLPAAVATRTGARRPAASRLLGRLVALQWLERDGSRSRPRYRPGPLRQVVRRYDLAGLDEDRAWMRDFVPCFALPPAVRRMVQHAFTELVNNAVDHSGGRTVTVSMRQTPVQVQLLVSDDGRGAFDTIREAFAIDDPAQAMLELAKGRLTTQPERHGGRGLYHTARLADVFDLHANASGWRRVAWRDGRWQAARALPRHGTSVYVAIALDTARTLDDVLRAGSSEGVRGWIDHTVVPLRLLAADGVLESRALARRAAWRLEQFASATLDFDGIADVGPAFADELWRVLPAQRPGLQLNSVNATPVVASQLAVA